MSFRRKIKLAIFGAVILIAIPSVWRTATSGPPASLYAGWLPGKPGKVWTTFGAPNSPVEAYCDTKGSFQPGAGCYNVSFFIYDRDSRRLYSPQNTKCSLISNHLPGTIVKWSAGGIDVTSQVFVAKGDVCFSSLDLRSRTSRTRDIVVYAAIVPYSVIGLQLGGQRLGWNERTRTILQDGNVLLYCDRNPSAFGLVRHKPGVDITSYLRGGTLPGAKPGTAEDNENDSAAVAFDLLLSPNKPKRVTFQAPLKKISPEKWRSAISHNSALSEFKKTWNRELGDVRIEISDRRYSDCYYASLAYLIALSDGGLPRPGSAVYGPFWVRDFAYISDAFYAAGRGELIDPGIRQIMKMQNADGGINARTSSNYVELDASGQAIYVMLQDYRRTGDKSRLNQYWPTIRAAADFIRIQRSSNPLGILPPSLSAEDLGRPDEHHYWDDFWAIRGLRDAAFAASVLGINKDSAKFSAEADSLVKALKANIKSTGVSYIPNGPEDLESSSMARGTSCAIVPCDALDNKSDPLVIRSFDEYWKRWIEPNNGGFIHKKHFWPYAGCDLALDYLALNQPSRAAKILQWTIENDPTNGFYSWPEGMNPRNLTFAEGDMPHGWMCASYILLLRNILASESGDSLRILRGAPADWFKPGKRISVRNLPSKLGKISYSIESFRDRIEIEIDSVARAKTYQIELSGRTINLPGKTLRAIIGVKRVGDSIKTYK